MKGKPTSMADKLVWIAIGSGALFWLFEAVTHVFIFHDGTVIQQIFAPRPHEIWMRLIVVAAFIAFAIYAQFIISQRKRAEEATKHAYAELNQIFNTAADGMSVVDKDFNVLRVNETFSILSGISKDEAAGKKCYEVFRGPLCQTQQCPLMQILGGKERVECDVEKQRNDGVTVPCIVTATPFCASDGELLGIVEDFKEISERKRADKALQEAHHMLEERVEERTAELARTTEQLSLELTERKRAEEALRRSEARLRAIFEAAEDVSLITTDLAGTEAQILEFSPGAERMFGYDREEVIGKPVAVLHLPEDVVRFPEVIEAMRQGKGGFTGETILVRKSGERFPALFTTYPIFDAEGNMTATLGVSIDITRRKQAEEALRESEAKYRQLFTTVSDAIMVFKADTKQYVDVNDAALRLYGYSKEEFLKLRHPAITAEPEKSAVSIAEALAGELTTIPLRYHKKKDGTVFPVEISVSTFTLGNRQVLCGVVRDITERKRAEEHIRTLTQELMKAQESERQRISRDLHDRVAQDLSTLKIGFDTLFDNQPEGPPEMRQIVADLSKMLQETITVVRDLAYDLRPVGLDQMGLVRSVNKYCEEFSSKNQVKVDFFASGIDKLKLDSNTKITLYRLIQECLNNVRKHADASQVTMKLVASFPNIILRIEDNGKGFDVEDRLGSATTERRMGLRTMQERVALLQGTMRIESRLTEGTKIFIEFPCRRENNGK